MAEKAEAAKPDHKGPPAKIDLKFDALIPYLKGEKPVVFGAYESYEVEVAMGIAKEFNLKVILDHVTHAQDLLDTIASYKVPVIVGSIYDAPEANERYDAVYSLPAELQKRGVKIALSSFSDGPSADSRNLPYAAGYAVAYGLPYDEAMKAITLNPAEMFGVGDKLGSLDVGKVANVVIANGDPLDVRTSVQQVFIEGVAIPMTSRKRSSATSICRLLRSHSDCQLDFGETVIAAKAVGTTNWAECQQCKQAIKRLVLRLGEENRCAQWALLTKPKEARKSAEPAHPRRGLRPLRFQNLTFYQAIPRESTNDVVRVLARETQFSRYAGGHPKSGQNCSLSRSVNRCS